MGCINGCVVTYIQPSNLSSALFRNYLRHMRHSFLLGISPPDFPEKNNFEVDYKDRATFDDLSDVGLKMAGFPLPNLTPDSFQHHLGTSGKGHSFQCRWP